MSEWQDRALILVRFGAERARDLAAQMGIGGATALRRIAHDLTHAPAPDPSKTREALQRVFKLDKDVPIEPLLTAIDADEIAARLQVYRRSVVEKPAQFEGLAEEISDSAAQEEPDEFACTPLVGPGERGAPVTH